jgi:hypothetical protein
MYGPSDISIAFEGGCLERFKMLTPVGRKSPYLAYTYKNPKLYQRFLCWGESRFLLTGLEF